MLAKESSGRTMLQEMDLVSTGGAPLAQEAGDDLVSQHNIKLVSRLGSSECGFLMSSWRNFVIEKDWSSLRLPDEADHTWLEFVLQKDDPGLFELVVKPRWPTKVSPFSLTSNAMRISNLTYRPTLFSCYQIEMTAVMQQATCTSLRKQVPIAGDTRADLTMP